MKAKPSESPDRREAGQMLSQARWLVLLAAVMWSTSGFFVKAPYFTGWPGPALAFWRAVFASVILFPLVRKVTWTWWLVPMTLLFAAMNYTYLTSMVQGSAANAIWLQCVAPVWVLLVGVLVLGERAVRRDGVMVAFAMAGVGVILYFESRGAAFSAVGWGLLSSVCYAGVVLSLRQLRHCDPVWLAAINHLVTVVALAPLGLGDSHFPSGVQWLMLVAFGVLQMALPYVVFAQALKRIPRARGHHDRAARAAAGSRVGVPRLGRPTGVVDARGRRVHPGRPGRSLWHVVANDWRQLGRLG